MEYEVFTIKLGIGWMIWMKNQSSMSYISLGPWCFDHGKLGEWDQFSVSPSTFFENKSFEPSLHRFLESRNSISSYPPVTQLVHGKSPVCWRLPHIFCRIKLAEGYTTLLAQYPPNETLVWPWIALHFRHIGAFHFECGFIWLYKIILNICQDGWSMFKQCFIFPKKMAFFWILDIRKITSVPQARTWNGPKQSCRVFVTSEQIQGWFGGDLWMATGYPLVNQHSNVKSPFFMGKSTINGHFPLLC